MRVIICGFGVVGSTIAVYLSEENNSVTVIDENPDVVAHASSAYDVAGLCGHAAHPETLQEAGAEEADLILAVTQSDEVNMVACQVAHSLFNVPKKIARIRNQSYLDPAWANLFSRAHMPIDVIISPEQEVARAIIQRLSIPGAFNVIPLADRKLYLIGAICGPECPVQSTAIGHFAKLFPDLSIEILAILRDGEHFYPGPDDQVLTEDEVFFLVRSEDISRAMAVFGHEEPSARHVAILGGGNIGLCLAQMIREGRASRGSRRLIPDLRIVERDTKQAYKIQEQLPKSMVLCGDALDPQVLKEAGVDRCETVVAVTNDDEANILASLLSKHHGAVQAVTLVNNSAYTPLLNHLGVDAVVAPKAVTVSSILQFVRRGRVRAVHSLQEGIAEVIEVEVREGAPVLSMPVAEIKWPSRTRIGAVIRGSDVIFPGPKLNLMARDRLVLMAPQSQIAQIEDMVNTPVGFE
mgnify:CR=1 FL=1